MWSSLGNAFVTATELFIEQHAGDDITRLALQRNRYPGVDIDFALRQIEGRQRTKDKLPAISHIAGWHYPQRLGLEQCSSEPTARYKSALSFSRGRSMPIFIGVKLRDFAEPLRRAE